MLKVKRAGLGFPALFFAQLSREPARTIVHAQQVRLELQVKVSEQLFQRRSGSQGKLRSFQPDPGSRASSSEQLFTQDGCPAREIPIPAAVARGTCCSSEQLYGWLRSRNMDTPIPIRFRGGSPAWSRTIPRLRPDPAPLTPIPLRVRTILRSSFTHPV